MAHCDELQLVAVTRLGDVGVDVERVRDIERWARVADRVFGAVDRAALGREIANGDDPSTELKAIGSGISGLSAHRDGWHPAGLRVAELPSIALPDSLAGADVRYQAAVAVCAPRDAVTFQRVTEATQARPPRITPTSASTA